MIETKEGKACSETEQAATPENFNYKLEYQPALVEEAVLRAILEHSLEADFRLKRDDIYTMGEETREETFQLFHQQWYERLDLHKPLQDTLDYWPHLKKDTHRCLVVKARSKKDMGAELFVGNDVLGKPTREDRSIIIQMTPELLIQTESLLLFLRRELLHIVDMLNPKFRYQPNLPRSDFGPTYDRLLQQRYRVLWDIIVDGRLRQAGFLSSSVEKKHWKNFKDAFSGPAKDLRSVFYFFFYNAMPKHDELVSFALSPESWLASNDHKSHSKGICPLCRFPSFDLISVDCLPPAIVSEITKAHPDWNDLQLICRQCNDLYEGRSSQGPKVQTTT